MERVVRVEPEPVERAGTGRIREPGKVAVPLRSENELSGRPVDVEHDTNLPPPRSPDAEMHATVRLAFRADGERPSGPGIVHRRKGSGFAQRTAAHGVTSTGEVRNEAGGWPAHSSAVRSAGIEPSRGATALRVPSRSRANRWARRAPSKADMRARRSRRASERWALPSAPANGSTGPCVARAGMKERPREMARPSS